MTTMMLTTEWAAVTKSNRTNAKRDLEHLLKKGVGGVECDTTILMFTARMGMGDKRWSIVSDKWQGGALATCFLKIYSLCGWHF